MKTARALGITGLIFLAGIVVVVGLGMAMRNESPAPPGRGRDCIATYNRLQVDVLESLSHGWPFLLTALGTRWTGRGPYLAGR